jgi:N-acetylneuraminic acid mutarotase
VGAAAIGNNIYVAAGRFGGQNRTTFEIYDVVNDRWSAGPPVPTARSGVAAAALNNRFYLFGGEDLQSINTFSANERFDPATNRWEQLEPMPTARHGLGAAVVGNSIYVVGGGPQAGLAFSRANERFTP